MAYPFARQRKQNLSSCHSDSSRVVSRVALKYRSFSLTIYRCRDGVQSGQTTLPLVVRVWGSNVIQRCGSARRHLFLTSPSFYVCLTSIRSHPSICLETSPPCHRLTSIAPSPSKNRNAPGLMATRSPSPGDQPVRIPCPSNLLQPFPSSTSI